MTKTKKKGAKVVAKSSKKQSKSASRAPAKAAPPKAKAAASKAKPKVSGKPGKPKKSAKAVKAPLPKSPVKARGAAPAAKGKAPPAGPSKTVPPDRPSVAKAKTFDTGQAATAKPAPTKAPAPPPKAGKAPIAPPLSAPVRRVKHSVFGVGRLVRELPEGKVEVHFDKVGRKTLLASFVELVL